MLIALDYDNTYDADYEFWDAFVDLGRGHGKDFILLTYRDERYDWTDLLDHIRHNKKIPVYCTRGVAKKWWWEQFGDGRVVDVWIDDRPEAILYNSQLSREGLYEWRRAQAQL